MFHIVTLLLFSSIMFAAVYQFWSNKKAMKLKKNHLQMVRHFLAWWFGQYLGIYSAYTTS